MALKNNSIKDPTAPQAQIKKLKASDRPFTKVNFIMMGVCALMIIVGFLLMSGGGDATQTEFNPEIFSTRRIVVGPTITFLGFLFMAFAIIWTPKKRRGDRQEVKGKR